jgi:dTDP-glucose pyrophosphorylase
MAGRGSRFKKKGVETEKHRLRIKNKTMFEWAMQSLEEFFSDDFIFVSREANDDKEFINRKCDDLGIKNRSVVEIERVTKGQASTAMKAEPIVEDEDDFAIYNIDTYIGGGGISREKIEGSGHIPLFKPEGEKWSFVEKDSEGRVVEVTEKERISELATVGFYYFGSFELFKEAYESLHRQIEEEYGEVYVAPLYSYLIDRDKKITTQEIPNQEMNVLGTPEDVVEFWPEFEAEHIHE